MRGMQIFEARAEALGRMHTVPKDGLNFYFLVNSTSACFSFGCCTLLMMRELSLVHPSGLGSRAHKLDGYHERARRTRAD